MKRLLTCLIAPLLVLMLASFTPPTFNQDEKVQGKDSTAINVSFSPAQLIVEDNRTTEMLSIIVKENTTSNLSIAKSVEGLTNILSKNAQERRCESLMERMTIQTGYSSLEIENILHKKKVYDMVSYTLFVLFLMYLWYACTQFTYFSNVVSIQEVIIRAIAYIALFIILFLLCKYLGNMINYKYHLIQSVINSPPG